MTSSLHNTCLEGNWKWCDPSSSQCPSWSHCFVGSMPVGMYYNVKYHWRALYWIYIYIYIYTHTHIYMVEVTYHKGVLWHHGSSWVHHSRRNSMFTYWWETRQWPHIISTIYCIVQLCGRENTDESTAIRQCFIYQYSPLPLIYSIDVSFYNSVLAWVLELSDLQWIQNLLLHTRLHTCCSLVEHPFWNDRVKYWILSGTLKATLIKILFYLD